MKIFPRYVEIVKKKNKSATIHEARQKKNGWKVRKNPDGSVEKNGEKRPKFFLPRLRKHTRTWILRHE